MADVLEITIENDGTIKVLTEGVSAANHMSADDLLSELEADLGGGRITEKRKDKKALLHRRKHVHHKH